MNPQPQTIIHHSAVIVNRPNRRNEPQTVSEPSEIDRRSILSWIALQMNPKLCYIENFVFINTTSLVFSPRTFLDIDCEKEPESDG